MTRFVLATTIFCFTLAAVARPAGAPNPAPPKAAPVYVKIIWPVDPASPPVVKKNRPVVESWIAKNVKDRLEVGYMAATAWVPLVGNRDEATAVWDGKVDDKEYACAVSADIIERKDGRIKILFKGWGPDGGEVAVTLDDEPGSREVAPVTDAKTGRGVPQVAIIVAPQAK
jgi:hypothetical protein